MWIGYLAVGGSLFNNGSHPGSQVPREGAGTVRISGLDRQGREEL